LVKLLDLGNAREAQEKHRSGTVYLAGYFESERSFPKRPKRDDFA
jgi:hypothetical protein